jgi:hypothetical protein
MYQGIQKLSLVLKSTLIIVVVVFLFSSNFVKAAVGINKQINFQGKVVNTDGTNVANASYTFVFSIYNQQAPGGAVIWTETKSLAVTDGIFQTNLGDATALPGSVDFNSDSIYLGVKFSTDAEMTPRVRFTAAPYAMNAGKVAGLTVTDTTGTLTIGNGKTVSFSDAFTTTGAFGLTLNTTGVTSVTLPTSGVLIANPMTTVGDLIYGGTAGAPTRLAGSAGFLTSTGAATPTWTAVATDYFSQYALLAGRVGGQTLNGGNAANDDITINGTSNATKTTSYVLLQPNGGNVGIGNVAPAEALDVTGNIKIGSATTGTVRATTELVMRQDGDTYGASILRLRNRNGENGAIFETTDTTATLVDFIFKTSVAQRNIRMESRATAKTGINSFHIGGGTLGVADPDNPSLSVGDNYSAFRNKLAIGDATYALPTQTLAVTGDGLFTSNLGIGVAATDRLNVSQSTTTTGIDGEQIAMTTTGTTNNADNAGLRIDVTSGNTGTTTTLEGIMISNLTGAQANSTETALKIGTGWDLGLSVASGGVTITAGALAINNATGITSNQATMIINAGGTVDVQDILNSDSLTTDTGGVTIAAGQTYGGSGAVTLASTTNGLTLNSGNDVLTVDATDTSLAASGLTTLTFGANVTMTNASGDFHLQPAGTATTANVQIGAGGIGSTTPDLLVLDTKSTAGDPTATAGAMYFNVNTGKFRCSENGTTFRDCVTTPGGSTNQLQYNDGTGNFAGMSNAVNASGYLNLPASTAPATPASGVTLFSEDHGDSSVLGWMSKQGFPKYAQDSFFSSNMAWAVPSGVTGAATAPLVSGMTVTHNGATIANPAPAATNFLTATTRVTSLSANTAGSSSGWRAGALRYWFGNAAELGGFKCSMRWGNEVPSATNRGLIGMMSVTTARANQNPSADLNFIGAYWNSTDVNIKLGGNDGTGTASITQDCGANFPARSTTAVYHLEVTAKKNATQATLYLKRLDTVVPDCVATINTATDMPANTTFLAPRIDQQTSVAGQTNTLAMLKMHCEQDN